MESETFLMKESLLAEYKENQEDIRVWREKLSWELKIYQPINTPYINYIKRQINRLQINSLHIKDRLDKLDGCF